MQIQQPSPEQCDAADPLLAPSGFKAFACWYPKKWQPLRAAVVYQPGSKDCELWTWASPTAEPQRHYFNVAVAVAFWQGVLDRQSEADNEAAA